MADCRMGIHTTLTTIKITVTILEGRQPSEKVKVGCDGDQATLHGGVYLPTRSSSFSEACGRCFFQMSMVKRVELLLKMEVSEDIRAAIITAIMSPRKPVRHKRKRPLTTEKEKNTLKRQI